MKSTKSMTLKQWILSALTGVLCIVILSFLIYTILVVVNKDKADEPVVPDPVDYEFTFEGQITLLNDIKYHVVMNGKDGDFELVPNKLAPITGTYKLTQGKGYTFFFNDANGTEVRTQYDASTKEFGFIYTLDLGSARGSGNVKLTWKNEDFILVGDAWGDIPFFAGSAPAGFMNFGMQMVCKADDTFRLFSPDFATYVTEINGAYAYENGAYVFTVGEKTYTSELNEESGLHEVDIPIEVPVLNSTFTAHLIQVILTVD